MAQLGVTVPDAQVARVIEAVAMSKGWTSALGVTKAQFAKAWLVDTIRTIVQDYEGATAAEIADRAARNKVATEIELT